MAFTGHGHHIPGTPREPNAPSSTAKCGGIQVCKRCKKDTADIRGYEGEARIQPFNPMMQKKIPKSGEPISLDELVSNVEDVLRRNFDPIEDQNVGLLNPYNRRARNIVHTILASLDIAVVYRPEEDMRNKKQLNDQHGNQVGKIEDIGDGSVEITVTDPSVRAQLDESPDAYSMMTIEEQKPETD